MTIHGSGDQIVVFTYLALLNVALVVSAQLGKWEFLKPLAFFVTAFIMFFSLAGNYFSSTGEATAMLTLHALIFLAITTIPQLLNRSTSTTASNVVLILNSLGFLAGYAIIREVAMPELILPAWILAGIHALVTWQAFVRLPASDRLARVNLGLTCLFVTLGLTFAFHDSQQFWTTIWAIEGFAFGLIGFSFRDRQLLVTSAIAFGLALLRQSPSITILHRSTLRSCRIRVRYAGAFMPC